MTTEQAKEYQAYLSANVKSQSDKVLMTREMREAAEREKAAKRAFKQSDVRIRFPDGTQVQGTFNSDETVSDIYAFVREQIASQQTRFQLRSYSPPTQSVTEAN
jgi:tether containing UBX domain for GLUT4